MFTGKKIAIIGGGKMGSILARGMIDPQNSFRAEYHRDGY